MGKIKLHYKAADIMTVFFLSAYMFFSINSNKVMYIGLMLFCVWVFVAMISAPHSLIKACKSKIALLIYCYVGVILVTGLVSFNLIYNIKLAISAILIFSPCIIWQFYKNWNPMRANEIAKILLGIWILISSYSILISIRKPGIGRFVTMGEYADQAFVIGGVNVAIGCVLIGLYMLYEAKDREKNKRRRIFELIIYAVQLVAVIFAGSTICLLCFLVGTLIICLPKKSNVRYTIYIVAFFIFLIAVLLHQEIGNFIIRLSEGIDDITYSARFASVGHAIAYGLSGENQYLFERIGRPLLSLETFISHPFFGVAYKYGNYYPLQYEYGVGSHGEWADVLAKFGVWGLFYFSIFWKIFKEYYKNENRLPIWFLMWFVLGLINPCVTPVSTTIIFVIVPGLKGYVSK